jgi:5-methylcytosine-specific restriction protein A
MARKTHEWIGKTDDEKFPPRVRLRVAALANNCCQACGVRVRFGGEVDHKIALINGGENRERNAQFLCAACHSKKTKSDVAEKSKAAKTQRAVGPLKREQSAWSKRYHEAKARGIDPWRKPKVTT